MTFRRALLIYAAWFLAVILHILLRVALVLCIPIIFVWSSYGMKWTQKSAQASFEMTNLFLLRWPRFPRLPLFTLAKNAARRCAPNNWIGAKKRGKAIPFRRD